MRAKNLKDLVGQEVKVLVDARLREFDTLTSYWGKGQLSKIIGKSVVFDNFKLNNGSGFVYKGDGFRVGEEYIIGIGPK